MELTLTSPAFSEGDWIPLKHSARGDDLSPCLCLSGIAAGAKSLAVTLEDVSHPLFPNYCHWAIWDIPVRETLPEGVPRGKRVGSLGGAVQGRAYGRHRYKGPKPPGRRVHCYRFTVYVLDCECGLPPKSKKAGLLARMDGHILQTATLTGIFGRGPYDMREGER